VATTVRLYQRLDSRHSYRLIPVKFSRNGSPIADPHATAFYLRYRANGKRPCIPAGSDVLEANNQRKVIEARLATGEAIPTTAGAAATAVAAATRRKVIATEAAEYIERIRKSKKYKMYKGYKDAVDLFLSTCKKTYFDELTRDDMIAFRGALNSKYACSVFCINDSKKPFAIPSQMVAIRLQLRVKFPLLYLPFIEGNLLLTLFRGFPIQWRENISDECIGRRVV
jgi:hypothetical protein